jgi:hypothetical protein
MLEQIITKYKIQYLWKTQTGDVAQVVEHLSSKIKVLSSISSN